MLGCFLIRTGKDKNLPFINITLITGAGAPLFMIYFVVQSILDSPLLPPA